MWRCRAIAWRGRRTARRRCDPCRSRHRGRLVSAFAASPFAGGSLVAFVGDHGLDPAMAQFIADHAGRVRAVSEYGIRAGAWPATTKSGNVDLRQHRTQHRTVIALPAGDDHRKRSAMSVNGLMDLRGQPAAGAADAMTRRFNLVPGQILVIRSRPCVLLGTGRVRRVLARTRDRRVDRHRPVNLPGRIGLSEDPCQHAIPGAHRRHTGDVSSTPSAMGRTVRAADHATGYRSGTGKRYPPRPADRHRMGDHAAPCSRVEAARPSPTDRL